MSLRQGLLDIGEMKSLGTKEENEHLLSISSVVRTGERCFKYNFSVNSPAPLRRCFFLQGPIANNCQKPGLPDS